MTEVEFDIHAIFERMYFACGVSNDYQLGNFLAVTPSTVQSWRNARQPPLKACYKIYLLTRTPMEWLIHGESSGFKPGQNPTQQCLSGNVINISEGVFAKAFQKEIVNGIRMDLLQATDASTIENLEMLAKALYRNLNDTPVLPESQRDQRKTQS